MESNNIHHPTFIAAGLKILTEAQELLVLIRYPGQAGSRDFKLIKSPEEYKCLLNNRSPADSVTLLKSFELLRRGIVTVDFVLEILENLQAPEKGDWLLIWEKDNFEDEDDSNFFDNKVELREELEFHFGKRVSILSEPDWLSDETSINAYAPHRNGKVYPGTY